MSKSIILLLYLIIVQFSNIDCLGLEGTSLNDTETAVIEGSEEAIERALFYTGFDKIDEFKTANNVVVEQLQKSNVPIPFLEKCNESEVIWQVNFANVPIGVGTTRMINRDFEVLIDGKTGKLLRIFSIDEKVGSSDTLPQPSIEVFEEYFNKCRYKISPFAIDSTKTTFNEALNKVKIASPSHTKIIKAFNWDLTYAGGRIKNAWLIIMRGIEGPVPSSHGGQPDWAENFMMSCIDANTGEPLFATTAPFDPEDANKRLGADK